MANSTPVEQLCVTCQHIERWHHVGLSGLPACESCWNGTGFVVPRHPFLSPTAVPAALCRRCGLAFDRGPHFMGDVEPPVEATSPGLHHFEASPAAPEPPCIDCMHEYHGEDACPVTISYDAGVSGPCGCRTAPAAPVAATRTAEARHAPEYESPHSRGLYEKWEWLRPGDTWDAPMLDSVPTAVLREVEARVRASLPSPVAASTTRPPLREGNAQKVDR